MGETTNPIHGDAAHAHDDDEEPNTPYVRSPGYIGKFEDLCENLFHIHKRRTTIKKEFVLGVVQWISCLYVLPVVPEQLHRAHYEAVSSIVATCAMCCMGCIYGGILTNMPFIIAPPTSVSIFLAVFLQQQNLHRHDGNNAVIISGVMLMAVGLFRPFGTFIARLIPDCIQASTAVGIGLITALAGATEVGLVVRGKYTVLDMGEPTPEIYIAVCAVIVVAIMLHFHVKGAFCIGLFFGTAIQWMVDKSYPRTLVLAPRVDEDSANGFKGSVVLLMFNLTFLYILTLNGLARSMSDLAKLTKQDGTIPRGRWLFIVCGFITILSGTFSGPPILISPESAAGIKAGAKTGLSTVVCGILFGILAFFSPLFAAVPPAGTAPLLIMVGVLLFQNAKRIDWYQPRFAVPAYCCLFFIPFTYSILRGVSFGYAAYVIIGMFTGDFWYDMFYFLSDYLVPKPKLTATGEIDESAPQQSALKMAIDSSILTATGLLTDPLKTTTSIFSDMTYSSEIKGDASVKTKSGREGGHNIDGLMGGFENQEEAAEAAAKKHEEASALFKKLSGFDVSGVHKIFSSPMGGKARSMSTTSAISSQEKGEETGTDV